MSRIHCGWCGEEGHRINHCKNPTMEELYNKHKTNGNNYNNLQLPIIQKLNMYISSTSTYSLKELKAIASYIGIKNIGKLSRMELRYYICKAVLNENIIYIPKIAFTISPLVKINCCQVIKSTEESESTEELSECCICLNNVTSDMFVKFNCNHNTCIDCFKELVKCKTKINYFPTEILRHGEIVDLSYKCYYINCPMCRSNIKTIYSENDILSKLKNEHINIYNIQKEYYLSILKNILKTMIK